MPVSKKKYGRGFQYFSASGKKITKEKYLTNLKISRARKKTLKLKKVKQSERQKSKPRLRVPVKSFKNFTISNPDTNTETDVMQARFPVASPLLTSEADVFAYIEALLPELADFILENVPLKKLFTLGYNFTFHWSKGAFTEKTTRQTGWRSRTSFLRASNIDVYLSELTSQILDRFNVYQSRKYCIGVTLDDILLEVQIGKSRKLPTKKAKRKVKPRRNHRK